MFTSHSTGLDGSPDLHGQVLHDPGVPAAPVCWLPQPDNPQAVGTGTMQGVDGAHDQEQRGWSLVIIPLRQLSLHIPLRKLS